MDKEIVFSQSFFSEFSTSHCGFVICKDNGGWFHALKSGEPAYSERFMSVEHFQNGKNGMLAWVRKFDGTYKAINEHGREVKFEHALPF